MSASAWLAAADALYPPASRLLGDPVRWVTERTGEHLWSVQQAIIESVRDHRRTAVPSCHGAGKSFCAARVAAWWLDAHPPGDAFVVTSAPTDPQVKAVLWREITRAHRKGNLPGRVTQDAQWKIADELVAFGRKPADIAAGSEHYTVTAFQGIHARYLLVIFDEAAGIDPPLWIAATSLLTNDDARFLVIGNPDDPQSEFARVCDGADPDEGGMSARGWNVIPINAFNTPNFTDEPVEGDLRQYLVGPTWVEDFTRDVGAESAIYEAKVLGRFPTDSSDGTIPWSWLRACKLGIPTIGAMLDPVEFGVDVGASDNGDLTVIRERRGMHAGRRWTARSSDPEVVARAVVMAAREARPVSIKIDEIGVGWAIVALVSRDLPGVPVVGVNVAERATSGPNGETYVNLRSKLWWEVGRGLSRDRAWDLITVDDRTLTELATPRWSEDASGRILIEPKDDIRKRLGRSTDDADALLLAYYQPPPAGQDTYADRRLVGTR